MKPAAAAVVSGGSVAAFAAISASDVSDWLAIIERISESKAGLLVLCLLFLVGLVFLLVKQWHSGAACEARIEQLTHAMASMYALLATDDRYPELPSFDDFVANGLDLRKMHKARAQAGAYSRPKDTKQVAE
ncbi:MAG: hypothetical protein C0434_07995 [Xanthomonadaceae bacterium]|nr:hypothetical protein [Xanthomonadaceae bacterium]